LLKWRLGERFWLLKNGGYRRDKVPSPMGLAPLVALLLCHQSAKGYADQGRWRTGFSRAVGLKSRQRGQARTWGDRSTSKLQRVFTTPYTGWPE
jgi:hypothetical protein